MRKFILLLCAFTVGYVGRGYDMEAAMEQPNAPNPIDADDIAVRTVNMWYFPTDCQDALAFAAVTDLTNTGREQLYREKMDMCFEEVSIKVDLTEQTYELPPNKVVIIPDNNSELSDEEYDKAFIECLEHEEEGDTGYCEEAYEDFLTE